jgi:uncharacterized RDD family membrane protein YckC
VITSAQRKYAGPVSRTIAYALDALIVVLLVTAGAAIADLVTSVMGTWIHDLARVAASVFFLLLPAMLAAYCALFWALAGRTPGMALLGLRVVAVRAPGLSWTAAAIRAVVLAYFPLGAAWVLVDRRRQAVHDKLARTAVIRVD